MAIWKHLPQENEGDYFFDGQMYVTTGIETALSIFEIHCLKLLINRAVQEKQGLDYLQVFQHEISERKIFCIDNLSRSMIEERQLSPDEKQEQHYWTMMFAEEYGCITWYNSRNGYTSHQIKS